MSDEYFVDALRLEDLKTENILASSIISFIQLIEVRKPHVLQITPEVKKSMRKFTGLRNHLLEA